MRAWWTLVALSGFVGASIAGFAQTKPGENTIASHVRAAYAAADDTWLILFSELCGGAQGAGGRASSLPPPPGGAPARPSTTLGAGGRQSGPPPREQWYYDPVKVFDNLYVFPTNDVNAWAIQTSDGIIMIDATYDYSVKDLIVDAMPKVGLDPKQIKYVVVTHGHGDHSAGVKYLQDTFGARVLMSEADWNLLAQPARGAAAPIPKRDMVVTDGQRLTLGDTSITMYVTPGHTLGTISLIIPVKDKGTPYTAAFWGGTSVGINSPVDNVVAYSASARRFSGIAAKAKADILLSNHGRVIDFAKRVGANRANPAGPNAFILNPTKVTNYLAVADHCAQAIAIAQGQKK